MTGAILVTGGSGYIAGFLIRQLIDNGWTVHTTVRSLKREAEVRGSGLGGGDRRMQSCRACRFALSVGGSPARR